MDLNWFSILILLFLFLQHPAQGLSPFSYGSGSTNPATVNSLKWFGTAKLGMFMHDGPVTQWGSSISWPLVCMSLPCTVQTMRKPGDLTPTVRNITYDVTDLYNYIDALADLSALVYDPLTNGYQPFNKEWIKKKAYTHLRQQVQ